tara:strand:- start:5565 stop:5750 length:186 start_codon:yes stop_codon:yes gene_type:complete
MIQRFVKWFLRKKGVAICHLCNEPTLNLMSDKLTCYGCEHEVMGYEHEHDAILEMLYGDGV